MAQLWKYRENLSAKGDEPRAGEMAERLGVTEFTAALLARRGVGGLTEMDRFLSPGLKHLPQPGEIPGLTRAAEVLARGLAEGRKFAVWGDYDVDGVTASALVMDFLSRRGYDCLHRIPNRMSEGYGLNTAGIEDLAKQGVGLLITVDCGISNLAEVRRANELGMEVVISDHHLPGESLPEAAAVCNPRLEECGCGDMAGVGVAFMLVAALNRMLPGDPLDVRNFLDLVALGTIADVVRLTGHNRVLVKNGLLLIKEAARPGVSALKEASGYDPAAELGAGQVGFNLAPRINAAGRIGHPEPALDMLLAPDRDTALPLAKKLDRFNTERRALEEDIHKEALEQAESQAASGRVSLTLYGESWHSGVIGIVASRIVERFHRPTVVLCRENGMVKGSGRSIRDFHLFEALEGMDRLFVKYGGHKLAAGMTLIPENFTAFSDEFEAAAVDRLGPEPIPPTLLLDGVLPFTAVDHILLRELDLLQPFGPGNPEPVFISPPVEVVSAKKFGKNHAMFSLRDPDSGVTLKGKAWRMAERLHPDMIGRTLYFAFTPKLDTFRGIPSIELRVRDWKEPDRVHGRQPAE